MNNFDSLPQEMKAARRWLFWKSVANPDPTKKPRKVPMYGSGYARGKSKSGSFALDTAEDLAELVTFDAAVRALQSQPGLGLGFALGPDASGNHWQGVDLDQVPDKPALGPLSGTLPGYVEVSPSGKGFHSIGYGRPFHALGSNPSGVEAYSSGRYFTCTGRVVRSNPIIDLSEFVAKRLVPIHSPAVKIAAPKETPAEVVAVTAETMADLREALNHLPAGDRDVWQRVGHRLKALGEPGRELWFEWSATSELHDPEADAATWESFKPSRTGYPAIFTDAAARGWLNPGRGASHVDLTAFDLLDASGGHQEASTNLADSLVALTGDGDVFDVLPHIVDKWLPCDEVTLLAGHGGGGKSYVSLSLGVHVSLGLPFGGLPTTQSGVLFFSGEDGKRVLQQRLAKICRSLQIAPSSLEGKLHLLDASDIDPALHREQRIVVAGRSAIATETRLLGALSDLVQQLDVGLVIVDNASDAYDGNEIERARVRGFVRSLRSRIARPGRAVLLLCHVNKASASGGRAAGAEDYSGSTAWHNSVRSRLSLTPAGADGLTIEHAKANLGAKAGPVRLQWRAGVPVVVGGGAGAPSEAEQAAQLERDNADKLSLLALLRDFEKRGEKVTTSYTGPSTVFKLLRLAKDYPEDCPADRLTSLLRSLEGEGLIRRTSVKTADRKSREVFMCS